MADLFAATRAHDLPPMWDGRPVAWGEWKEPVHAFVCGRGRKPIPAAACSRCKSTAPQRTCTGIPADGGRLYAHRCPDCGLDTVMDTEGEWWDLDPTDYQDEGSTAHG